MGLSLGHLLLVRVVVLLFGARRLPEFTTFESSKRSL